MEIQQPTSWFDFHSLADLKAKADTRPEDATRGAAQQFESLFLNLMLREMRKTVSRSGLLGSDAMETYQQMFDQQLALGMSRAGGIGLAPVIQQQLEHRVQTTVDVLKRRQASALEP
jgi:flagellar protein FlgJ